MSDAPTDAYYRMVAHGTRKSWLDVVHDAEAKGSVTSVRTAHTATFIWPFAFEDSEGAWRAYHAMVKAYASCVAGRILCDFATIYRGKTVNVAVAPQSLGRIFTQP